MSDLLPDLALLECVGFSVLTRLVETKPLGVRGVCWGCEGDVRGVCGGCVCEGCVRDVCEGCVSGDV